MVDLAGMIGKKLLIGVTYLGADNLPQHSIEFAGVVTAAEPLVTIESGGGDPFTLPPDPTHSTEPNPASTACAPMARSWSTPTSLRHGQSNRCLSASDDPARIRDSRRRSSRPSNLGREPVMVTSMELSRLNGVVDESELLATTFDRQSTDLVFHLAILANPHSGSDQRPQVSLRLKSVGRVVAMLRDLEHVEHPAGEGFPGFGHPYSTSEPVGPPVPVGDLVCLVEIMNSYQPTPYWLAAKIFDAPEPPGWLDEASLDVQLSPTAAHSMHLWVDENPGLGRRDLHLFVTFDEVELQGADGRRRTIDEVADAVSSWWHRMAAGDTRGQFGVLPAGPLEG